MQTLAELVEEWLDVHHGKTRASYQNTIRKFLNYLATEFTSLEAIGDLKHLHIRKWLNSLNEAPTTKVKHLNILKAFCSYVVSLENPPIRRSPIPKQFKLPIPKDTQIERILSVEDVDSMISVTTNERNKLILKTLYLTGIRVSELCGLQWKDITPQRREGALLNVYGKGGKTRKIYLPQVFWLELKASRGDALQHTPIFVSANGKALAPTHIDRIVKRAAKEAELENAANVSAHWLRHSHATHALNQGTPVHLVQATLGHSSLETTSKYLHPDPDTSSGEILSKRLYKLF